MEQDDFLDANYSADLFTISDYYLLHHIDYSVNFSKLCLAIKPASISVYIVKFFMTDN
ncbi:MAG: hypothetical protein ACOCP4_06690 [Candidatus Woesearchaeota archaeon]